MKTALFLALCTIGLLACGGSQSGDTTTPTAEPAAAAPAPAADAHAGMDHQGGAAPAGDATIVPPGEAKPGDTSTCPITGETFVVADNSPKAEHDGKTYYFCCPGCEKTFAADPGKYVTN